MKDLGLPGQLKSAIRWLLRQPRFIFLLFLLVALPIGVIHGCQTSLTLITEGNLAKKVHSVHTSNPATMADAGYWLYWIGEGGSKEHGLLQITHVYDVTGNDLAINQSRVSPKERLEKQKSGSEVPLVEQLRTKTEEPGIWSIDPSDWPPSEHPVRIGQNTSYHVAQVKVWEPPTVDQPGCMQAGKLRSFNDMLKSVIDDMEAAKQPDWVTQPLRLVLSLQGYGNVTEVENRRWHAIKGFVTGETLGYWFGREVANRAFARAPGRLALLDNEETWHKLERYVWDLKYAVLTIALKTIDDHNLLPDMSSVMVAAQEGLQALADKTKDKTYKDLVAKDFADLDEIYDDLNRAGLWTSPAECAAESAQ